MRCTQHLAVKVTDSSQHSELSAPELLKFLLVRDVINSPQKLSHPVISSKKSQAITPDPAYQVQGEVAANLI